MFLTVSHLADLEPLKTKFPLNLLEGTVPYSAGSSDYPNDSQTLGTWTVDMYLTAAKGPIRHLDTNQARHLWINLTRKRSSWHPGRLVPPKTMDQDFLLWLNIHLFLLSFFSFSIARKNNTPIHISQDIAKWGSFWNLGWLSQTGRFPLPWTKKLTDLWLEQVNTAIPVNESINTTSLTEMICVPSRSCLYLWSLSLSWDLKMSTWLGHSCVRLLRFSNYAANCSRQDFSEGIMIQEFLPLAKPWVDVRTSENMIRSLSLTSEYIPKTTAKAYAAQQRSLDSLVKVVLDNRIALDYLLAEQGGVCVEAGTTCCAWRNPSGEAETQLH